MSAAFDEPIPPLSRPSTPTLGVALSEALATLRECVLMPRDVAPKLPHDVGPEDDVVVLLHGFFASAGVLGPLRARLERKASVKTASFSHAPGPSVRRLAAALARFVDRLPTRVRLHLVGHSLGGIVARWYVQELGGHARVAQTISLGSPFGGTERARPFPFLVGRDLHPASPTLAQLRARAHEHDVPHTSIVADLDQMVVPRQSAVFPRGDAVVLRGRGHNSLLFDREATAHVIERVRRARRTDPSRR